MRITGGDMKGRRWELPKGIATGLVRPTSERVREAMFGTIETLTSLSGARVLDLYAGSGALGLEALSRGAASAVFVDADGGVASGLQATVQSFGVGSRSLVLTAAYPQVLSTLGRERFSLALIDPPYEEHPGGELLEKLAVGEILADGALVVMESGSRNALLDQLETALPQIVETAGRAYRLVKERRYGDTSVLYLTIGVPTRPTPPRVSQ